MSYSDPERRREYQRDYKRHRYQSDPVYRWNIKLLSRRYYRENREAVLKRQSEYRKRKRQERNACQ